MTRPSAAILLLFAAILALTSCARYDPMPKWTGYSIEVKK